MKLETILKALANSRRLEIVKFLKHNKEANVVDISDHLNLSFKSTSRHLQILKNANILENRHISNNIFYSLIKPLHPLVSLVLTLN